VILLHHTQLTSTGQ